MSKEAPRETKKLVKEAEALKKAIQRFTKYLGEAAEIVNRMESVWEKDAIETLLEVKAGITSDDARFFRVLGEQIRSDPNMLQNGASPETLRLLSHASDVDLQAFAARAVKAGIPVGAHKIERIEEQRRAAGETEEAKAAKARWASLQSFAATHTSFMLRRFESRVEELLKATGNFRIRFTPPAPQEGFEMEIGRPGYFEAHAGLAELAAEVLSEFELIFGPRETIAADEFDDPESSLLQQSLEALLRFASGEFGHRGGFAFDAAAEDVFSPDLADALAYLSTQRSPGAESAAAKPNGTLYVLELGAGAGGQAIGLMSAGFRHAALYEWVAPRADTLRANWDWPVVHADLKEVPDSQLARYRGIDLLAGGIPAAMFTRQVDRSQRGSENDLIPELVRAVRVVNPRAVMFEGSAGMAFEPHVDYLAAFKTHLADLGYAVDIVKLETSDYGLPLAEKRLIIVGLRKDEPGSFIPPILGKPVKRYVPDALGDLVIRYESPLELRGTFGSGAAQHLYDAWAHKWRDRLKEISLPGIPRVWKASPEPEPLEKGGGFDRSALADEATKVEDFPNKYEKYYLPKLTEAVLSRARGFPDAWKFHGEGGGNVDMIADALSPIVAKMVGLQIYAALTGESVDLDAAILEPIINEHMIGKKLRLNAERERHHLMTQAEMMIRGEANISRFPDQEARSKKLKELIEHVEPIALRRTNLRTVVDRIRLERERQKMEDEAWEDRLFANGVPEGREDWLPER